MVNKKFLLSLAITLVAISLTVSSANVVSMKHFKGGDHVTGGFPFKYISECSSPGDQLTYFEDCTEPKMFVLDVFSFGVGLFFLCYIVGRIIRRPGRKYVGGRV